VRESAKEKVKATNDFVVKYFLPKLQRIFLKYQSTKVLTVVNISYQLINKI